MMRIVIVGAGFGGLQCARGLVNQPVEVLLLDRNDYHLFTPLLYQVASSLLNPSDIAYPVRAVFRRARNVTFRVADVDGIDVAERRVQIRGAADEPYDILVLATGAALHFFNQQAIQRYAFHLNELPRAMELRNHVLACFEAAVRATDRAERRAWTTFVIVGGGPTGVEYAGALAELVHLMLRRDFRSLVGDDVRIIVVEGNDRLLAAFPESLGRHAGRHLERRGVALRLGQLVESAASGVVRLRDGDEIASHTLVWAAGVRARIPGDAALPTTPSGRIRVGDCLEVGGCENVYAIGDVAGCVGDGRELPMLSAPAMQQGRAVAANILRRLTGRPPHPYRYRDKGIMATIGRHAGVAKMGKFALRGFMGWVAWLFVHLYFIIGFRNRFVILLQWAWNYILYDRPIRFVVRAADREVER